MFGLFIGFAYILWPNNFGGMFGIQRAYCEWALGPESFSEKLFRPKSELLTPEEDLPTRAYLTRRVEF